VTEDAEYLVPDEVSKTAARLGLVGTVAEAVALSVPFDHAGGNRRFEQFVFKVDDLNVTGVVRLKPGEEAGQRPQRRLEKKNQRLTAEVNNALTLDEAKDNISSVAYHLEYARRKK
jgi:hypothetical protein